MAAGKEVDALNRGFRARALMLGLLVLGGLGAAAWSETREQGMGEPESRHQLMVVTQEVGGLEYYGVLERGGFAPEVDSYAGWLELAREARPESEAEGEALLLEYADGLGYGYIVLEQPGSRDLSGLELDPTPAEFEDYATRDYAVLSVGDLAFPHHLSVSESSDDTLVRLPGYGALEAVFAQPSLLARVDEERPTIEELQLEARLRPGQVMAERPASFAADIEEADAEIDAALGADAAAATLVPPHTTGSALFDPEGGVLVIHHALEIYSEDAKSLKLHPAEQMHFDYLNPEAVRARLDGGALSLQPCMSLAGGVIEMERAPRLEAAVDGSALAISTRGGSTWVWHRRPGPGCEWGEIAELEGRMKRSLALAPARAHAPGSDPDAAQIIMAQVGDGAPGLSTLRVWSGRGLVAEGEAGEGAGSGLEVADLLWLPEARSSSISFVDGNHLALLSTTPLPAIEQTTTRRAEHVLHLADRRTPGAHLRVPADFFAPGWSLLELVLVAPPRPERVGQAARGPAFVLTAAGGLGETQIIRLEISAVAWFEYEAAALAEHEALGGLELGEPMRLHALSPDQLLVRRLRGEPEQARISPNAAAGVVAYALARGPEPSEIGWFDTEQGEWVARQLTNNAVVDTLPRLSADADMIVFLSMVRSSISATPYSVPRVMALPR